MYPKQSDSKEKASSRSPASSLSLPTPPDSAEELSTSPSQSLSSSAHGLSQPAQRTFDIFKSIKQGHGFPESPWIKLRLEPNDYSLLEEKLKVEDLWGYVDDKIRFDYNPQTYILIIRMPTGVHDFFTDQVVDEIKRQIQGLCKDVSRPEVSRLASSIQCCTTSDIFMLGDCDRAKHSPDSAFRRIGTKFPALIIETSFTQKRKDLLRLADDYITSSYGNIKLVLGLDIEYRNSKKATVSIWECEEGIEEDGVPYICTKNIVDNKPFRDDDLSFVAEDALVIPLSVFALDETPLNAKISIPYAVLKSYLKEAEDTHQELKASGSWKQPLPGLRVKKRQRTPEEQLKVEDEARFVASEKKAEEVDEKDSTWTPKKTRQYL